MINFKQYITEEITQVELDNLEKILDKLWKKLNIDIEFTRHFFDRLNDMRNNIPITVEELSRLFSEIFKKFGKKISNNVFAVKSGQDIQSVLNDTQSNINVPFVLVWNKRKQILELISKTIIRKKNFKTPNPKLRV